MSKHLFGLYEEDNDDFAVTCDDHSDVDLEYDMDKDEIYCPFCHKTFTLDELEMSNGPILMKPIA